MTSGAFLELLSAPEMNISSIFLFCAVLYGGIAALWLLFKQLPKESQEGSVQHTGLLCLTFGSMSLGMHLLNKCLVAAVAICAMQWEKIIKSEQKQVLMWMIVP